MANSLMTIGLLMISLVQEQLLQSSLIKEVYQVQGGGTAPQQYSPSKSYKTNFGSPKKQVRVITAKRKITISPYKTKRGRKIHSEKDNFSSADAKWLLDFESQLFFQELVKRLRFVYTLKDLLLEKISVLFSCCKCWKPRERKSELFNLARAKLSQEFDVINILKMLKKLEVITGVFLNKKQQAMLDMQKRNVIKIGEDDEVLTLQRLAHRHRARHYLAPDDEPHLPIQDV